MDKPIIVTKQTLVELSNNAKLNNRKRKNLNFHTFSNDTIQRLLNAIEPDTYITPHKHENPDKREVFILLEGKMKIILFNDNGEITNSIHLQKNGVLLVEIPPKTWHTVISFQSGTVYYEVKDGPYDATNDKKFAPWAPSEEDTTSAEYLHELKRLTNS